jgi:hypothetical protein
LKKAVMISQERKHVFNATVYSRAWLLRIEAA